MQVELPSTEKGVQVEQIKVKRYLGACTILSSLLDIQIVP